MHAILISALLSLLFQSDRGVLPLGTLVQGSDLIAIGSVSSVSPEGSTGSQRAVISLEDVLKGPHRAQVSVRGSTSDAELPGFYEGIRVLVFLAPRGKDGVYEPYAGDHGVMALRADSAAATRARRVVEMALQGQPIALDSAADHLRQRTTTAPPRVLVASLLEELARSVTTRDAALLKSMACSPPQTYLRAVRLWAIGVVGRLKIAAARTCLEQQTDTASDVGVRIPSVDALGDLADARSVPVLLRLIRLPVTSARVQPTGRQGAGPAAPRDFDGDSTRDGRSESEDTTAATDDEDDARSYTPAVSRTAGEGRIPPRARGQGQPNPRDEIRVAERPQDNRVLVEPAVLALGKMRAPAAVPAISRVAYRSSDAAVVTTAVHALGLIATAEAAAALDSIATSHPSARVRDQSQRASARVRSNLRRP